MDKALDIQEREELLSKVQKSVDPRMCVRIRTADTFEEHWHNCSDTRMLSLLLVVPNVWKIT